MLRPVATVENKCAGQGTSRLLSCQPNAGVFPRAATQMRYFDFVPIGLKIMSHYFKIIQEIVVFGKSTVFYVS